MQELFDILISNIGGKVEDHLDMWHYKTKYFYVSVTIENETKDYLEVRICVSTCTGQEMFDLYKKVYKDSLKYFSNLIFSKIKSTESQIAVLLYNGFITKVDYALPSIT